MGKRKHPSIQTEPVEQRHLLAELDRRRTTQTLTEYKRFCRELCFQDDGLKFPPVRARVWRDLLLLPDSSSSASASSSKLSKQPRTVPYVQTGVPLPANCHAHVIDCDVARALWWYHDEAARRVKREEVKRILLRCTAYDPRTHYYQGLHEVIGALQLFVGSLLAEEVLVSMADRIVHVHLRSFCDVDMRTSESLLVAMHSLVRAEDPGLAAELEEAELAPQSHYALAWVLTWFTHHLNDATALPDVARLFDFLLAIPRDDAIAYVGAALILSNRLYIRAQIRQARLQFDGDLTQAFGKLYSMMSNLPQALTQEGSPQEDDEDHEERGSSSSTSRGGSQKQKQSNANQKKSQKKQQNNHRPSAMHTRRPVSMNQLCDEALRLYFVDSSSRRKAFVTARREHVRATEEAVKHNNKNSNHEGNEAPSSSSSLRTRTYGGPEEEEPLQASSARLKGGDENPEVTKAALTVYQLRHETVAVPKRVWRASAAKWIVRTLIAGALAAATMTTFEMNATVI